MTRKCLALVIALFIFPQFAYAVDSVGLFYGSGKPDQMRGGRIALGWGWHKRLYTISHRVFITGYWDASFAHFRTRTACTGEKCRNISIAAFAPMFRIEYKHPVLHLNPYLEFSIGAALQSQTQFGHRHLGSALAFQDMVGGGVRFGPKYHWDINYHYLHYSNANIVPPNLGIDVKQLIGLRYFF